MTYSAELAFAVEIVRRAADPALALFGRPDLPVFDKPDCTIVTQADLDVNDVIVDAIASAYPDDAILSEEGPDDPDRLAKSRCWIVDPIDGTSHFERGDRDWSIMLALAVDGRPVVGAVNRPAMPDLRSGAVGVTPTPGATRPKDRATAATVGRLAPPRPAQLQRRGHHRRGCD